MRISARKFNAAWVLLGVSFLLSACGGGGSGDSASLSPTPTAAASVPAVSGTVTGFGSVFVDGVEIDDSQAYSRMENAGGGYDMVPLQLGQRVRVARGADGAAGAIDVDAAVMGTVTSGSIDAAALTFTIANQIVKANTDSAAGPVTFYGGGYTGFGDIAAGDLVAVFGSIAYDNAAAAYVVQATRIEKKTEISAVRVTGAVANLDAGAKTFSVNGLNIAYGSASVVPSGSGLADGQNVAVWGAPASLVASGSTLTLTASRVRIMNSSLPNGMTSGLTQFCGLVSNYSAGAGSFDIDGVTVSIGSASISPVGAAIANGAYVQVQGTVGDGGVIAASEIRVRIADTADSMAVIRLKGALQSVTDQSSFVLRGVPVDASGIDLASACPGVTLAAGTLVNVSARVQVGSDVVLATSMSCPGALADAMRTVSGTAGTVDAAAKTFVLTIASAATAQAVQWSDTTVFAGITADTLDGKAVVVDGYLDANDTLVARMIRNPSVAAGRMDADAYASDGMAGAQNPSWTQYRNMRR